MKRSQKDYRVYVHDLLSAIERIEEYKRKGRREYLANGLLQDGIIRQVSIVGEAATKLPTSWKEKYHTVPWKKITAMRNILIHDYSDVSAERVWTVVEEDIPRLKKTVEEIAKDMGI